MSEHRTRSNDRGSGECLADCRLASCLGTIELGRRGWRSVEVRNVDQPRNPNACGDFSDTPRAVDVYIIKGEISFNGGGRMQRSAFVAVLLKIMKKRIDVLCLVITANKIVDDVGVSDTFCDLFLVADVPFLEHYAKSSSSKPIVEAVGRTIETI